MRAELKEIPGSVAVHVGGFLLETHGRVDGLTDDISEAAFVCSVDR